MNRIILPLSLSVLSIGMAVSLPACSDGETRRRIVLITLDTLREDRFLGDRARMPESLKRVQGGAIYDSSFSTSSSTQPTHATLFTAVQPWRHGVTRNGMVLGAEHVTLAECLQAAGYETAAVVASFPLHRQFGFAQGFDRFVDEFGQSRRDIWCGRQVDGAFFSLGESVTEHSIAQIDQAVGDQQFFWFHYFDPHSPYGDREPDPIEVATLNRTSKSNPEALPGLVEKALAGYDRDVHALDQTLAKLLDRILLDADQFETHIIITADHGESFGEEGSFGHVSRLIRSQIHVPTAIVSPRIAPGRYEDPVGSIDIMPTILAMAEVPPPEGTGGRDLSAPRRDAAQVFGMRRPFRDPYRELGEDGEVVVLKKPKFYCVWNNQLFIGDADEIEAKDREPSPEVDLNLLKNQFAAFAAELAGKNVEEILDPESLKALEELGYTR